MPLLLATALLAASVAIPPETERWTRLELDDYVIYSAARDNVTRDVAQRLQLMRDGVAMITRLNVHPPHRVTVIVFHNDHSYAPYRDAALGRSAPNVAALHAGTPDSEFILIDADSGVTWGR